MMLLEIHVERRNGRENGRGGGREGYREGGTERHIHTENCLSKSMQTESKLTEFEIIRNLMSPNPTEICAASPLRRHSHLLTVMRPVYSAAC